MRAQFLAAEIGIGLRRNLTMTIAVVVTTAVSLTFVGAALLLRAQIAEMKDFWYDRVEVSVFLCGQDSEPVVCPAGEVTQEQREQIEADLEALPQVDTVYYESKQEAFERFREQFEDSALSQNITPEAMPESYRVKLVDPEQFEVVAGQFVGAPGVEQVQDQKRALDRFFSVLNGFTWGAWLLAAFVLVAAVIMIATTIRLAAFNRRRETGIMRLVGASSFSIQLPFVLEAVIAGMLGAAVASGFLLALEKYVITGRAAASFTFTRFIGRDEVWAVVPWLFALGIALSALASLLTLRKYLRV
jgi:cell division transport system permease protein